MITTCHGSGKEYCEESYQNFGEKCDGLHALKTCFKQWVTSCGQHWDTWRLQRTKPAEGSFQRVQSAEAIFGNRPDLSTGNCDASL